jgi:hypothetical protein
MQHVLVPLLAAAVACPAPPVRATPGLDRPRYVVEMRVAPPFRTVTGRLTVTFAPSRPTKRLVFRLWPNGPPQLRAGARLDVDVAHAERPDPTTLVLPYRRTVSFTWRLRLPRDHRDRNASFAGGLRLGTFLPLLAWDPRRGWLRDPPAHILAESAATPAADFDLRVHAPTGYRVLATGDPLGNGRFRAHAVRDVAVAVGRFHVQRANEGGVTVRVASAGATADILPLARDALRELSARYGPYAWRNYTVVIAPDLHAIGIEYPTLSYVGRSRFNRLIVDHETAHQWFYSLVGNDQARDPWLDETLATWAQARLASDKLGPAQTPPSGAAAHIGAPMAYWDHHPRAYFYGVYGAGVSALHSLGNDDAVDCAVQSYVARRAYSIAHPADLLDELNRFIPGAESRLRPFGIQR